MKFGFKNYINLALLNIVNLLKTVYIKKVGDLLQGISKLVPNLNYLKYINQELY